MDPAASTVLWRLRNARRERAHAMVLPGGPPHTLAFFVNEALDRAENYDTVDLAVFRADDVKRSMTEEGWQDDE